MTTETAKRASTIQPSSSGEYQPLPGSISPTFEVIDVEDAYSEQFGTYQWKFINEVEERTREKLAAKLPKLGEGKQQSWRVLKYVRQLWSRGKKNSGAVDFWDGLLGTTFVNEVEAFINEHGIGIDPVMLRGCRFMGQLKTNDRGYANFASILATEDQQVYNQDVVRAFLKSVYPDEYAEFFTEAAPGKAVKAF